MEALEIQNRVKAVEERKRFEWNLGRMDKNRKEWISCLKDIHDKQLYRHDYGTFEEFCEKRLGISRDAGYKQLEAHGIRMSLQDNLSDDPVALEIVEGMSESSLREAAKIEPEKRENVIRELGSTGMVTAKRIRNVERIIHSEKPARAKVISRCPHCGGEI